jgi:hypothetical protein
MAICPAAALVSPALGKYKRVNWRSCAPIIITAGARFS